MREIRTSERITEKDERQKEIDRLNERLIDCWIGSDEWYQIKAEIERLENGLSN